MASCSEGTFDMKTAKPFPKNIGLANMVLYFGKKNKIFT